MSKTKVLFVCEHNSARSQMAEAIMNHFHGDKFEAGSAGFETRAINPFAVKAMADINIDISKNVSKKVFDIYRAGNLYDYVITVCDAVKGEKCPIFPGVTTRLNWSFSDPSLFEGTDKEKLQQTIEVRNEIKAKIQEWINRVD
jgi:arsenate reductase